MQDEIVKAVRDLRKNLGDTQQAFATRLGLSISAITNYEAGRRPAAKPLFALAQAASVSGQTELAGLFMGALTEELDSWPFQILGVPATATKPAHGYLLLKLEGAEQFEAAGWCRDVLLALNSPDPEIKVMASNALEALREHVSAINENPLIEQFRHMLAKSQFPERSK